MAAGYPLLEFVTETHYPVLIAHTLGMCSALFFWWNDADHFKEALYKVKNITEDLTGWDIDRDGHRGEPPPRQPTGRTVIDKDAGTEGEIIDNWDFLPATQQVEDIIDFARVVWQRSQNGQRFGQKEFRELQYYLPSGFKVTDGLHSTLFRCLQDGGIAQRQGNNWIITPAPRWENRIRQIFTAGE